MNLCSDLNEIVQQINNKDNFALYFSDGVCGVAESLYPKLESTFNTHFPEINLQSVVSTFSPEIKGHFHVFIVPSLLVFIDGKETIRMAGTFGIEKLNEDLSRIYALRFLE